MDEIGAKLIEEAKSIILSDPNDPKRMDRITDAMNKVYRHFKKPEIYPSVDDKVQWEIWGLERLL